MVTSCPACTTTFRVTTEQLKARQGKVRCGQCLTVFDGFKALTSVPDEPLPEPVAPPAPEPTPPSATLPLLDFEMPPAPVAKAASAPLPPAPSSPAPGRDVPEPTTVEVTATRSHVPPPAPLRIDEDLAPAETPKPRRRALWIAVAVVLLVGLLLQALYVFRVEVATAVPGAKPMLDRMCAVAGCEILPPRRTDVLAIEGSDLQADPAKPNLIVLTATLRNRGNTPVAYPSLELTLTNPQDQTIARRVIAPGDYLRERAPTMAAGMPPLTEVPVRLELDTGDLRPAGYRLYLFYP